MPCWSSFEVNSPASNKKIWKFSIWSNYKVNFYIWNESILSNVSNVKSLWHSLNRKIWHNNCHYGFPNAYKAFQNLMLLCSLNCPKMLLKYFKKVLKHYGNSKMLPNQSKAFQNGLKVSKCSSTSLDASKTIWKLPKNSSTV